MLKKLGKYLKGLGFLAFLSALGMIVEPYVSLHFRHLQIIFMKRLMLQLHLKMQKLMF